MEHHNRIGLLLIVMGLVIGWLQGAQAQSQSPESLVVALNFTILPGWFNPAGLPEKFFPFRILYASIEPVVLPLPGDRMPPALAAPCPEAPVGRPIDSNLR